jgi:hypothetical protein
VLADQAGETCGECGAGHADLGGRRRDRPSVAILVQRAQCAADGRIVQRPIPGGGRRLRSGTPCPQCQHQHEIQQPVEDGVLTGFVAGDLGGKQVQRRPALRSGGHDRQRREHVEKAVAHVAAGFISAPEHDRGPGRAVAVGTWGQTPVGTRLAAVDDVFLSPVDHDLGWGGRTVGDRESTGCADEGDVARSEAHRRGAGVVQSDGCMAAERGHDRERRSVSRGQRPRRRWISCLTIAFLARARCSRSLRTSTLAHAGRSQMHSRRSPMDGLRNVEFARWHEEHPRPRPYR